MSITISFIEENATAKSSNKKILRTKMKPKTSKDT